MRATPRTVLLVQLPIPPQGPDPIRGNVPLAAAYLKLFADRKGLGHDYDIQILPCTAANTFGDHALVQSIVARNPWLVGFTCYLWNIERTLWVAQELKHLNPQIRIILGGPEVTPDNAWVLDTCAYDFAVIGEGEQTFTQLLLALLDNEPSPMVSIPGLYVPPPFGPRYNPARLPLPRTPMPDLNQLGSPYLAGILDAADEKMLLLETIRGCVFKCKFCYYPKSYDKQYYLDPEAIRANLRHARERGAEEVVLLDPTLNQRKDFPDFLELLAEENPGHCFRYFGELRAEGIAVETAQLLRAANFTEVEVGLQSTDPDAMIKMDRKNNLRAFEKGVRAMLDQSIRVKVDLIIGLPGDTVESVRRSIAYLKESGLFSEAQVFNLAVLPGTAFREESSALGLKYQPRPPYYVLQTPTLRSQELFGLMDEAQQKFAIEYDAQPPPVLIFDPDSDLEWVWRLDLDSVNPQPPPLPGRRSQAFTLWLTSCHFDHHQATMIHCIRTLLGENPFTTLQVVLELDTASDEVLPQESLTPELAASLMEVCQSRPTYLDKFYAMQPGRANGAKRLIIFLPLTLRSSAELSWLTAMGESATVLWRGDANHPVPTEMEAFEFAWQGQ